MATTCSLGSPISKPKASAASKNKKHGEEMRKGNEKKDGCCEGEEKKSATIVDHRRARALTKVNRPPHCAAGSPRTHVVPLHRAPSTFARHSTIKVSTAARCEELRRNQRRKR
ncbi:hypothetical protein M0R45_019265 [Rubus argutus]|uniref:Uncharacterized protein n=1 Tax=Rubus argutus TaxID=59490 RepID=A0AAW1X698_RUBAR